MHTYMHAYVHACIRMYIHVFLQSTHLSQLCISLLHRLALQSCILLEGGAAQLHRLHQRHQTLHVSGVPSGMVVSTAMLSAMLSGE